MRRLLTLAVLSTLLVGTEATACPPGGRGGQFSFNAQFSSPRFGGRLLFPRGTRIDFQVFPAAPQFYARPDPRSEYAGYNGSGFSPAWSAPVYPGNGYPGFAPAAYGPQIGEYTSGPFRGY
jgi:hypothetical protein